MRPGRSTGNNAVLAVESGQAAEFDQVLLGVPSCAVTGTPWSSSSVRSTAAQTRGREQLGLDREAGQPEVPFTARFPRSSTVAKLTPSHS